VLDLSGGYATDIYTKSLFGLRNADSLLLDADIAYTVKDRLIASVSTSRTNPLEPTRLLSWSPATSTIRRASGRQEPGSGLYAGLTSTIRLFPRS